MDNEMIERCAKAAYNEFYKIGNENGDYIGDYNFHDGKTGLDGQFDLNKIVVAVIKAMHEPTEKMLEPFANADAKYIYQTMIDAIINEK